MPKKSIISAWITMWNRAENYFEQGNLSAYSQMFKCPRVFSAKKSY